MAPKTRTTSEAMAQLTANHAPLIEVARDIARQQCLANGSTNSRLVRLEMERQGIVKPEDGKCFWFGAVFRTREFEPTDEWVSYSSVSVHERRIRVWKLRSPSSVAGGHKGRSRPAIAPTSSDGEVRPSQGSGAPAPPPPAPKSKAEPLPCMQLDLLAEVH